MKIRNNLIKFCLGIVCAIGLIGINGCSDKPVTPPDDDPVVLKKINETKVVTYDGPKLLDSSKKCKIFVNEQELFVYETRVNHGRVFTWTYSEDYNAVTYFDFEGEANIRVEVLETVTTAKISPLNYEIAPIINNKIIEFTINQPSTYVVEFNDKTNEVIHIIANPLEDNAPSKDDKNVVYLGPGIYNAGAIPLTKGQTLYIAGGAYVYGYIRSELEDNIMIRGRGILAGSIYDRRKEGEAKTPIELRSGKNINVEGITILDPAGWAVAIYNCDEIKFENVKIFTARANGDGISVQGSKNVYIHGGFVRSRDDSLVVKDNDGYCSENITFDGINIWTDLAQSMEVGFETNGEYIKDVTFKNINVIYNFHKPVMSIHNADIADISNITYKNITLEDGQMLGDSRTDGLDDYFIELSILYSIERSKHPELGNIDGVLFENIKVIKVAPTVVSKIQGYPTNNAFVKNVSFKNFEYEGKHVSNAGDFGLVIGNNAEAPTFSTGTTTGCKAIETYDLEDLDKNKKTLNNVDSINQTGVIVPEFARLKGDLSYLGKPLAYSVKDINVTHGSGKVNSTPVDDGLYGNYENSSYPVSNLIDKDSTNYFRSLDYKEDGSDEFVGITIGFNAPILIGSLRLIIARENIYSNELRIEIRAIKNSSSTDTYTRVAQLDTYEISPTTGNIIDINFTAIEYRGIQIRIYQSNNNVLKEKNVFLSEIELYEPSLAFNKTIVDSTDYNDVYPASKLTDGIVGGTSYYESKSLPAYVVIDLGSLRDVKVIGLYLPNALIWTTRREEIELLGCSNDSVYSSSFSFTSFFKKQLLTFDPSTGNNNVLTFETPISMRFLKIVIYSNDIAAGYNAQLSEVMVFE